jgi:hypothetical protein
VRAPEESWTYVPVDGAVCGNAGTTAGFFVNPTSASRRLVGFFQGGGACFDQGDCQASSEAVDLTPFSSRHPDPGWPS